MKKILFLFFCLSIGLVSCSSDDDNDNSSKIVGLWENNLFTDIRDEFTSNYKHIEWDYDTDSKKWNKYEAGKYQIKGDSLLYINNSGKIYDRYKFIINDNILILENKAQNINISYTKMK